MNHPKDLINQFVLLSLMVWISGCVSSGRSIPAPVEDKTSPKIASTTKPAPAASPQKTASAPAASAAPPSTTLDSQPKSGFYTVKQGDTLIKIGLDHGQNWRDIMKWNAIENPNVIEVGQVLRITPPTESTSEEVVTKPVPPQSNITSTPTEAKSDTKSVPQPPNGPQQTHLDATEDNISFAWPVQGQVIAGFDDAKNKGIDISGKLGEPVLAAADGKVVYAGSGLRGYGNLVILKHNNTFLTAYAHNQSLAVKEDQLVKRGQKIAEMGNSDAEGIKLHFEIRKMGKPVDPLKLLSPR